MTQIPRSKLEAVLRQYRGAADAHSIHGGQGSDGSDETSSVLDPHEIHDSNPRCQPDSHGDLELK